MKRKSIIVNSVIAVILTALTIFYLSKSDVITEDGLSLIPWYALLLCAFYFFFSLCLLSLVDYFVYKTFTRDMKYHKCIFNTLSGHLGSSVTPYRVGHFPLMAYYQTSDGIKLSDTATGLIKCQIIYSITAIFVYTAVVITLAVLGLNVNFGGKVVALWGVIALGLLFHVGALIITALLAFNKPLQNAALNVSARLIKKIKKSFDAEKFLEEKRAKLRIFRKEIGEIGRRFYYYLIPMGLYLAYMFISGAAPYVCFLFISKNGFVLSEYMTFYVLSLSSAYVANVIPVPGGAGASEILFKIVFETVISASILGSVLLLWRASTFYFVIITEVVWFIVFSAIKNAKKINKE